MNPSGHQIKISIIITCFNDGEFLPVCIHSIEKIKAVAYELIIVNDGSSDPKTIKLLKELSESGYLVIDQPNMGPSLARNNGIKKARAPYILLVDADGFIEQELVYEGVRILDEQPKTGVVYSDVATFGLETVKRHLPDFDFPKMLAGNYIYISSVFRKKIWEETGGFDTSPALHAHQDWDFWIMTSKAGWHFQHIRKCLLHCRIRSNAISTGSLDPDLQKEIVKYITDKHAALYKEHALYITRFLKFTNNELAGSVKMLDMNVHAYSEKASVLEERLNKMESSNIGKIQFFASKIKQVFKSGDQDSPGKKSIFLKLYFFVTSRGRKVVRGILTKLFKWLYLLLEDKPVSIIVESTTEGSRSMDRYTQWVRKNTPGNTDYVRMKSKILEFYDQPVFSIIVPVFHPSLKHFNQMMESLLSQLYPHWELFLVEDATADQEIKKTIQQYADENAQVKIVVNSENGNLTSTLNTILDKAAGDFIIMLDAEDMIARHALFEAALIINENPQADLIYCDEDKIDEQNKRLSPVFKPDWSPDLLLSGNYISRFAMIRHSLVKKAGGFRPGFEDMYDYDLLLRVVELTPHIFHIPNVLYHHRVSDHSVPGAGISNPKILRTAQKALTESLARRGEPGTIDMVPGMNGFFNVRYHVKDSKKVTIVIPTKNRADVLEVCLKSIFNKTLYPNFEVLLIDNRSDEDSLFHVVKFFESHEPDRFRCIKLDTDFNFSKIMNEGVRHADGDYVLLLNNDTEIIVADWMDAMVEQAQRKSIGAVGAKLLYHNDTVQHGGVIIGIGGVADHAFVGTHKDGPFYQNYANRVTNYSAVTAACLMVRKKVYEEVGGFDEGFAVEFNDVDFCLKLISAGYYNVYLPHVLLYHHESLTRGHPKSSKESYNRHVKEVKRFRDRWKKFIDNDPFYNQNLSLSHKDFRIKVN